MDLGSSDERGSVEDDLGSEMATSDEATPSSETAQDEAGVSEDATGQGDTQGERLEFTNHDAPARRDGWIDKFITGAVRLSARFTGPVLIGWILLTVVGIFFAGRLAATISNTMAPPRGTQSADVQQILDKRFSDLTAPYVVVVMKDRDRSRLLAYRDKLEARLATDPRLAQVLDPGQIGVERQLSPDTTLLAMTFKGQVNQETDVPALRKVIATVPAPAGLERDLTGMTAISHDIFQHTAQQLGHIEEVGLALSAIVLIYVFGGLFAAMLPLLTGVMCISLNNGLLVLIARFFQTTTTNQFITAIVGLAIGIDYPLFLLSRFREELEADDTRLRSGAMRQERGTAASIGSTAQSHDSSELQLVAAQRGSPLPGADYRSDKDRWANAYIRACKTAGKATGLSGMVVAVSAIFLGMLDVSGLRPAAVSIVLVVLTALLLCFSFLPALLFACGRLRPLERLLRHRFATRQGAAIWERLNRFVVDHPVLHLAANLAIVAMLALPISHVKFWSPTISMLPKQMESMQGLELLVGQRESGQLSPIYVAVQAPHRGEVYRPDFLDHLNRVVADVSHDGRVASVVSMVNFNPAWQLTAYKAFWANPLLRTDSRLAALVDNGHGGKTALIRVVPAALPDSQTTRDLISDLHDKVAPAAQAAWPGVKVEVGGDQAELLDTAKVFTHGLPIVGILNLLGMTLLLGFAFRSVVLPIKAVLMNLLPLAAAMGVVGLVFQYGIGASWLHIQAPGYVMMMTPAILLTVLFALSMDYEVMILSRIREAYDRTGDNRTAILEGLGQSGKVIVGAAAIMFSVFAAYLFSDINPMREVGLALATAVFVDATVVRLALLPSAMMLMGRWNYWVPGRNQPARLPVDPDKKVAVVAAR